MVRRDSQVDNFANSLFFLLIIIRSGLLAGFSWSVCMLKSHRSLCVSFFRTGAGSCIYHLFVWSNWNFLHISQWITLPTQSCLALYSFCANLLHSLIMWLIVSSLSPQRRNDQSHYYYYYYYYSLRVFHTSVTWRSFTGFWVTASLLRSSGLFSVFWPISTML